jgi:uncharacterized protein YndB with AHSA1/START domain
VAGPYRAQALIAAPIEEVWDVVRDPRTHPEWWPEVVGIDAPESVEAGDEYQHTSKVLPFVDAVTAIWVAERIEHLKEAHFRCELSGTFARFSLTPAQDETFVEVETGIDPVSLRWRVAKTLFGAAYKRWTFAVLDALPAVITRRRKEASPVS